MFEVNVKEEVEKKNDLITRAEELINGAKRENRELTDDEAQELAEIRDDVRLIKEKILAVEELGDEVIENAQEEEKNDMEETREAKEVRALDAYIRKTEYRDDPADPIVMDKTSNSAVIPTTIANKIIAKVYDICPVLERSSKYNIKGKLEIPYYDESENAITVAYANEFEDLTSSNGTFGKIELGGFLAGSLVLISRSLINNSKFNIVDFVVERMAYAIKRWVEGELLNGTDGKIKGLSEVTTVVTADATNAVTADEVILLHDSIKDEFQQDAIWIMSPATRTAIRSLTSTTGEYLLNDDISSPFGTTLLGKPVYVTDNMNNMGAGKTAIYYGDMTGLATKFSEEMSIEVLREVYAKQHAVAVVGWIEVDGRVEQQQKLAKLVMHA